MPELTPPGPTVSIEQDGDIFWIVLNREGLTPIKQGPFLSRGDAEEQRESFLRSCVRREFL
jgi:hypothetical protein